MRNVVFLICKYEKESMTCDRFFITQFQCNAKQVSGQWTYNLWPYGSRSSAPLSSCKDSAPLQGRCAVAESFVTFLTYACAFATFVPHTKVTLIAYHNIVFANNEASNTSLSIPTNFILRSLALLSICRPEKN